MLLQKKYIPVHHRWPPYWNNSTLQSKICIWSSSFIGKLPFLLVELKISLLSAILTSYFASSLARLFLNEHFRALVFFHAYNNYALLVAWGLSTVFAMNPLSSNVSMHILLTALHVFLMVLVGRIFLNIKTVFLVIISFIPVSCLYVQVLQGLEGYFRDPGFDQNTVQDSGKQKISWRDSGFACSPVTGKHQNMGAGCGIFLPVCRKCGKSSWPE